MAHRDDNQRAQNSLHSKGSQARSSPTFQQLLQCDDSKWSHISSLLKKKEDDGNRQKKKSVLAKVKETAKKLKISLRKKKQSDTNESRCSVTARSGAVVGPKDKGEEDHAEYHSARMYDSKQILSTNKQDLVSTTTKNLEKLIVKQNRDKNASIGNTTDPHLKINPPLNSSVVAVDADTKSQPTETTKNVFEVHEFPERNSRHSDLLVSAPKSSANKSDRHDVNGENIKGELQMHEKSVSVKEYWKHKFEPESSGNNSDRRADKGENTKGELQKLEKGVSVKDYLMHKFEPGEDERALSKVITQAISPRRDKMREAMSSFLKSDESSEANSSNVQDSVTNLKSSKSLPASTNSGSKNGPIKQSYSLGSNATKASLNLNQTFRSTFASYQDHFLSSSASRNTSMNHSTTSSSTKTKPWLNHSHTSNDNETQDPVSSAKTTRVASQTGAISVRRVPVSRGKQTRVPSHTTNRIDANATRTTTPSTGDQGRLLDFGYDNSITQLGFKKQSWRL